MTITETPEAPTDPHPPEVETIPARASAIAPSDHKWLGLAFLGAAAAFLLVGAVVGLVLRAELADEGVQLVGDGYRRLFGMHATVTSMLFLGPAWIGLATHVVPLQIGAGRLAFPRLHAFALWLYVLGGGVLVTAYLVGPPYGVGFSTSSPVPPVSGGANEATGLMIVGAALVAAAMVTAALDLAVTILRLRTPGLTLRRLPMFSWSILLTSVVTLLATPVFLAGLTLFYLDQRFGGAMFLPGNPAAQALWQHMLWLFGRPEIHLLVLPGLGAACDIVATHARRPLISTDIARAALTLFAVLSFGAWAAGRSVGDALVLPTYTPLTALVVVPVGLLVLVWLATVVRGRLPSHPSLWFVAGAVVLAAVGALNALAAGIVGVEGSAWTTGHLHTVVFGAPTLLLAASVYHWAPKLLGRELSPGAGRVVFLGLFGGFLLSGLGSWLLGYDGAPAHVADYDFTTNGRTFSALATVGGALVALGVLALLVDVLRTLWHGGPTAPDDPYEGLTLEWATSSPPPAHSFDTVPEVRSATPVLDLRRAEAAGRETSTEDGRG